MNVRLVKDTTWHQEGRGFFTIPKGAEGPVLEKHHFYSGMVKINNRAAISRANKRYDERGVKGFWVYLQGKYRFLERSDCVIIREE